MKEPLPASSFFMAVFIASTYNPLPMGKISIFCILTSFALIIPAPSFGTSNIHAFAKPPGQEKPFQETDGWEKIDLRLREAWTTSVKENRRDANLECTMKTKTKISGSEREKLLSAGFKYRTVIGTIVTGSLLVRDLPRVSNLDFVQAMELAVPMSLKPGN